MRLIFSTIFICGITMASFGQQTWTLRNPYPTNASMSCLAYGNNFIIAVGMGGQILTSTDGISWTRRISGTTQTLRQIVWNNGIFLSIGTSGTIISSPDGITWTIHSSGTHSDLYTLVWGANKFVAAGAAGTLLISSDGVSWTKQSIPGVKGNINSVAWNGNKFVAGTDTFVQGYGYAILSSPDGINWTINYTDRSFRKIAWGANKFFGISDFTYPIYSSTNGIDWSASSDSLMYNIRDFTWANNKFFAINLNGDIITSLDGNSWSIIGNTEMSIGGITWVGNQYAAVVFIGSIATSPDGQVWTNRTRGTTLMLRDVTYSNGVFVAVGQSGIILTSPDGISWTSQASGTNRWLSSIVRGGDKFIVVGDSGVILTSTNAVTWAKRYIKNNVLLFRVVWGNGLYVAISEYGTIMTSIDGITWTDHSLSISGYGVFSDVVWGNGKFIITKTSSDILTSTDGITWTLQTAKPGFHLSTITYGDHQFVIAGSPTTLTSPDGLVWTEHSNVLPACTITRLIWGGNQYVFTAYLGDRTNDTSIVTSIDGNTWIRRPTGVGDDLYGAAYGNGLYVAVGADGTIITSPLSARVITDSKNNAKSNGIVIRDKAIYYCLPSAAASSLTLYDIRGRLIKTLINTTMPAGSYSVPIPLDIAQGRYILSFHFGSQRIDKAFVITR
jgi:hypothetical protein